MLSGEILTNKGWERVGGAMTFQPHRWGSLWNFESDENTERGGERGAGGGGLKLFQVWMNELSLSYSMIYSLIYSSIN